MPTERPTFRPVREPELAEMLGLMREFYTDQGYVLDETAASSAATALVRDAGLGRAWLALVAGKTVGYVVLTLGFSLEHRGRDAFIDEVFVRAAHRQQGIGRAIMAFVEHEAAALGVHALHLEVEGANRAGHALYEGRGFHGTARRLLTKRLEAVPPVVGLPFAKLEGAGNGYVAVDGRSGAREWAALAVAMCRPGTGVGADGLVVVQPPADPTRAAVRMRVFNPDGSEAEMSGNGIRLFAKFVLDRGIAEAGVDGLAVETGGGVRHVVPTWQGGRVCAARVAMGAPVLTEPPTEPLEVGGRTLNVSLLSVGNPHAVALLDEPVADFPLGEVGPLVERHARFPDRINFEVANVIGPTRLRARVFERGVGETPSSGTGATAVAAAARRRGLVASAVDVELPGGTLRVEWSRTGDAYLEGPATEVFAGVWPC